MTGTGTISFQNIPVAAPSGVSLAGARQGLLYNAGYIELGNPNIFDTSTYITDERYIVLEAPSGGLWMLSDGNTGWRGDQTTFTVINNGMEWQWLLKGGSENIIRAVTPGRNAGIEFYNIGAPTGPMAFMGYEWGTNGGLRFRTESGFPSNTIKFGTSGGDMIFNISASEVLKLTPAGIGINGSYITVGVESVNNAAFKTPGFYRFYSGPSLTEVVRITPSGMQILRAYAGGFGLNPNANMHLGGSSTARASLRIDGGVAPTTPGDGDIWYDGTDLFMNVGGTVKTFQLI